jgi:hypothetical protein
MAFIKRKGVSVRKITININNDITDEEALEYVLEVIKGGRISKEGKSYCHCTLFNKKIVVLANKRKNDIFTIYDHEI